jgi:hypothetical protein
LRRNTGHDEGAGPTSKQSESTLTEPGPVCKTSIPGSNPGGASNLFCSRQDDVNSNVNTTHREQLLGEVEDLIRTAPPVAMLRGDARNEKGTGEGALFASVAISLQTIRQGLVGASGFEPLTPAV